MSGNFSLAAFAYLTISQLTPNTNVAPSQTSIFDSMDQCPGTRGPSPHIASRKATPRKTAMDASDIMSRDFLIIAVMLRPPHQVASFISSKPCDVACWPFATKSTCDLNVGSRGWTRHHRHRPKPTLMTHLRHQRHRLPLPWLYNTVHFSPSAKSGWGQGNDPEVP